MASKKAAGAAVFNRARPNVAPLSRESREGSRGLPMPVPAQPPPPKRGVGAVGAPNARAALRALVPSSFNPEGEADPFIRAYKTKWLSKLDFTSDVNVQSLLTLTFLVLAVGERDAEAELIADQLIKHVDLRRMSNETRAAVGAAMYLSAWLKSKRHGNAAEAAKDERILSLLTRAKLLTKFGVEKNREWLSDEAAGEIADAVARKRVDHLVHPFRGILRWLNESGARSKAEQLLGQALDATRSLMRA
jgi:hypothetical protein